MNKKDFYKTLLWLLCIYAVVGSLLFALWCTRPRYVSDDIPWTVTDKYYKFIQGTVTPPTGAVVGSKNVYYIKIEYQNENKVAELVLKIDKEKWDTYKIGDVYMYPEQIVTNWEWVKESVGGKLGVG